MKIKKPRCLGETVRSWSSWSRKGVVEKICERGRFWAWSERVRSYGWWEWRINRRRSFDKSRKSQVRDRLGWGWRREACRQLIPETRWGISKGRITVIRNEDDVDGRARVTRDEERVLRGRTMWVRVLHLGPRSIAVLLVISGVARISFLGHKFN